MSKMKKLVGALTISSVLAISSMGVFADSIETNPDDIELIVPQKTVELRTAYNWTRSVTVKPNKKVQLPGPYHGGFRMKNGSYGSEDTLQVECSKGDLTILCVNTETGEEYSDSVGSGGTVKFKKLTGAVHKIYIKNKGNEKVKVTCTVKTI